MEDLNLKKNKIRTIANRNIVCILDSLKVPCNDRGNGLIQSCCPCKQHAGDRDNSSAFSWRKDIGHWVCWTHHCQEKYGSDIYGLVRSILGVSFYDALDWVSKITKNEVIDDSIPIYETKQRINDPISENNLKFLNPDPQYMLDRGFSFDVLRKYEVGFWSRPGTYMHDRVVFPIRDHDGFLVGYTGRTVHPEEYFIRRSQKYKKWIHGKFYNQRPKVGDFATSSVLYNLNNSKRYGKSIILTEGVIDGLKLEEANIHNWCATLGTYFSHFHRTILVKYGITDLYVAYDNDDPAKYSDNKGPGHKGWERVKKVSGNFFNLHRVELPLGKDCADLDVETLKNIFKC